MGFIQFESFQQLNMLINKLIQRLVLPSRGFNLTVTPAIFFAGEKKAEKAAPKEGGAAGGKGGAKVKAQKKEETPAQKAKKLQQEAEKKKQQQQNLKNSAFSVKSSAGDFYRQIVRHINIKKKTQRASFHEQSLMTIINISSKKDLNLMYEAYYNFLGHFTEISQKTVDALVDKTITLGSLNDDLLEEATNKVMDIFQNHQYLGYFPHYDKTVRAANLAKKAGKLALFVENLKQKPLIKLNAKAVRALLLVPTDWKDYIKLCKIFAYRANRQILAGITNQQLLAAIVEGVKRFEKVNLTRESDQFKRFLQNVSSQGSESAILWSIMGNATQASKVLSEIAQQDEKVKDFKDFVGKIEQGNGLTRLKDLLSKGLDSTAHKDLLK